jgi:hypothetical protein
MKRLEMPVRIGQKRFSEKEPNRSLSLDGETVDLGGITVFKAPELPGQKVLKGVGDHGHDDITPRSCVLV